MPLELNLPPDFYHATMFFGGADLPRGAAVTFGGSVGAGSPAAAATAINAAWNTHLKSVFSSTVTHLGTRVKFGPMDDGPFAQVAVSVNGSKAASPSPPSVAFLIKKISAIGGRQGTGRMYQPGVGEGDVDGTGAVSGSVVTSLTTAWGAFLTALNTASLPMYLLHSWGTYTALDGNDPVFKTVMIREPTPVTSLAIDSKVATQRRRLR